MSQTPSSVHCSPRHKVARLVRLSQSHGYSRGTGCTAASMLTAPALLLGLLTLLKPGAGLITITGEREVKYSFTHLNFLVK